MLAQMNKLVLHRRGVTLVEMLIVLGILGIILAAAAPSLADIMARRRVEMAAAELATTLAYARSEAAVRSDGIQVRFDNAGRCYGLEIWGGAGTCKCTNGAGHACSDAGVTVTEVKTVQLPDGIKLIASPNVFRFNPQRGVSEIATIELESSRVGKMKLSVNIMGRLASCSPDGSITGVVRCP